MSDEMEVQANLDGIVARLSPYVAPGFDRKGWLEVRKSDLAALLDEIERHRATPAVEASGVIQADRDAAADMLEGWGGRMDTLWHHQVRKGTRDDHVLVQAFARHRLRHRASAALHDGGEVERIVQGILRHVAQSYGHRPDILFDTANEENVVALTAAVRAAIAAMPALSMPDGGEVEARELLARALDENEQTTTAKAVREGHGGFYVIPQAVCIRALVKALSMPDGYARGINDALQALHERLPYPTEACAIVRSLLTPKGPNNG